MHVPYPSLIPLGIAGCISVTMAYYQGPQIRRDIAMLVNLTSILVFGLWATLYMVTHDDWLMKVLAVFPFVVTVMVVVSWWAIWRYMKMDRELAEEEQRVRRAVELLDALYQDEVAEDSAAD